LLLLLCARRPGGVAIPAGPRRRVALAGGGGLRVQQGLLRAGPIPGPPLHRDRPAYRAGHGRLGHLRHHRRPAASPHRHAGPPAPTPPPLARPPPPRRPPPRPRRPHPPPATPAMPPPPAPEPGRLPPPPPPPHAAVHGLDWRPRPQACAAWSPQRTRLTQNA